ncbi:PA14 domain-containing protein, partial [Roseovarius sp. MMSF_3305]
MTIQQDQSTSLALGLKAEFFSLGKKTGSLGAVDFGKEPDLTGKVGELDFFQTNSPFVENGKSDHFAAHFSGNLNVDEGGKYNFFLSSDDIAKLYINGKQVVFNRHSDSEDPRTNSKWITLDAGSHEIDIYYIENRGTQTLKLEWQGPDSQGKRETITNAKLSHTSSDNSHDQDNSAEALGLKAEFFSLGKKTGSLGAVDFGKEPDLTGKVDELDFFQTNSPFVENGKSDHFAAHFS